ncbi:Putative Ig [Phaffia rhodozyma]|uniref:Putative Ig n=1 Tax=Phaffia rhodozyma TaxID=264483 RepID=A0A0F7SHW8_PHARH|nr:Putative Ig [Phaffia rhodozyma]
MFILSWLIAVASVVSMARSVVAQDTSSGAPVLVYPIQTQKPPIAHVNHAFNFTLLPGTFTSSLSASTRDLNYTTYNLPSWLQFDPLDLVFYGEPSSTDSIGSLNITLSASEGTLSTNSTFNLTTIASPPPYLARSMASQLVNNTQSVSSATMLASTTGVLIHPAYSFSLGFVRSSVVSTQNKMIYYSAMTSASTTLPAWLTFDNTTATFNGVAPLAQGVWNIVLVGSEQEGFGDVKDTLTIEIGTHALDLIDNLQTALGLADTPLSHQVEIDGLRLDDNTIDRKDVVASVDLVGYEDWLSFDGTNQTLSGTPPSGYINGTLLPINLPITLTSISTNASYLSVLPLDIHPFPFSSFVLANTTAVANSSFTYSVPPHLTNQSSFDSKVTTLSAQVSPVEAQHWLSFDKSSGSLVGVPPGSADYDLIEVIFTATDSSTGLAGQASLGLMLIGTNVVPSTTTTNSGSPTSTVLGDPSTGGLSTGAKAAIGGAIGGAVALILLCLLGFCCIRRRARKKVEASKDALDTERKTRSKAAAAAAAAGTGGTNAEGEMTNVDLGPDPFAVSNNRKSTSSPIPTLPLGSTRSRVTPTPNGLHTVALGEDGARRLDVMNGLFASTGETEDPKAMIAKDSSGLVSSFLTRTLSGRSVIYSDEAFDHQGNLVHSDSIVIVPEPLGPVEPGSPPDPTDSDSTTFDDGVDSESRASWESSESFRWTSGDVGSRDPLPADSLGPPRPITEQGRDLTSSTFADAAEEEAAAVAASGPSASSSTNSLSNAVGPAGFIRSSNNFGSNTSIASPLSRFGDASYPHGFNIVQEDEEPELETGPLERPTFPRDDSRFASSEGDESWQASSGSGGPAVADDFQPRPSFSGSSSEESPTRTSISTRPRPRWVPSREHLPTVSHQRDRSFQAEHVGGSNSGHQTGPSTSSQYSQARSHLEPESTVEGEDGNASFADAEELVDNYGQDGFSGEDGINGRGVSIYGSGNFGELGYPASSAIYFAEPPTEPYSPPHRPTFPDSDPDIAKGSIRAIPMLGQPLRTPDYEREL